MVRLERAMPRAKPTTRRDERVAPWVMLAPTLAVMTLVGFYPLAHSFWVSLTSLRPTEPDKPQGFVGLDNYVTALGDGQFWGSIALTLGFTAITVGVSLILAVLLAVLFNQRRTGFVVLRTILLIPMLITPIAVAITWRIMLMPDLGVLNYLLGLVGVAPQPWTGSRGGAMVSVLIVDIWQWTPFMFLVIFAGLRALPRSPFEAAAIDGAGPLRTFLEVTLPMLKPVMVIAALLRIIDAMRTYDTVYIITRGGPDLATDLASVYLQRINFKFFDLGYGSATSWLVLVMLLAIVLVFVKLTGFMTLVAAKEAR